jgi:hypothetical protein
MDIAEQRAQRDGYVDAFRSRAVLDAIASGAHGRIAVTYVEWAGAGYQSVVVPWRIVASKDDADAFAYRLDAAPLTQQTWTSISSALTFAARQFEASPADGERRAIDISGDGHNNDGPPVAVVRDRLVAAGIVINGLPIMLRRGAIGAAAAVPLDDYYRECVIGGSGSFAIAAVGTATFREAIRRKMVLEIAGMEPALSPVADDRDGPPVDCLIGERLLGRTPAP